MMPNNRFRILLNIVFSIIGLILNIAINMVLTPFITNNIGIEAYGFIGLANNIVGYIDIISVALNSLAARYVALDFHKGDYKKANRYFNSVLIANSALSFSILIIMSICFIYLDNLISIPDYINKDVKILFLLVLINYILMLINTSFNIATFIKNRLDITALYRNVSYLIKALMLIFLFSFFTPHVWMVPVAIIISTAFLLLTNIYLTKKLTPQLRVNVKCYSWSATKEIVSNGWWSSISSLGIVLNSGLDLLVTNKFLNATAMGQLSVIKSITNIFNTFISLFTQAFRPLQLEAYSKNNIQAMVNEFTLAMKVTGSICSIAFAGLFALGIVFLDMWIPGQDSVFIYNVMLIVLIGDVLGAITYPLNYAFTIVNKLKVTGIINIANGFVNVISMLILLRLTDLGLFVVVITTAVLNIIAQMIIIPILVCNYLNLSYFTFYPVVLKSIINCLTLSFIFKFIVESSAQIDGWYDLLLWILLLGGGGALISLLILFNAKDRRKIIGVLIKRKQ